MALPDLDSLRCFDAAARRLNFSAAAREVALSPPAFTERIRRLEEVLGVSLFRRNNRRVELTLAGIRLLPLARRALEDAARCFEVRESAPPGRLELTIGCFYEVGIHWLVPAFTRLQQARPGRALQLRFGDSPELLRNVREGAIDAAITSTRLADAFFQHTALREIHFVFVAAPELILRKPLRGPDEARNHVLLDVRGDLPLFRYFLDGQPSGKVWAFQSVECLGTVAAIRHRLLAGAGVAVAPLDFVALDIERGRLARILPSANVKSDQFRLVWSRQHVHEAALRELAADLIQLFPRTAHANALIDAEAG